MRELSNLEIEAVSGAGLKVDGKCHQFDAEGALHFFIGWAKETIKTIWGSGSGSKPDPWA